MPKRIVRQPNGLFAEFSTIVDNFTVVNLTEREAAAHCLQAANWSWFGTTMSRKEAVAKVERAKKEQIYYGGPEEYLSLIHI